MKNVNKMGDIYDCLIGYTDLPLAQQGRELSRVVEEIKSSYKAMGLPDPAEDMLKLNSLCRDILDDLLYTTDGRGLYKRVTLHKV